MSRKENKMMRRRLRNAYISTIISISLVLLLVGVAAMLLVNAGSVSDFFKENMHVSVLMKTDVSDAETMEFQMKLESMPFVKATEFVSKAQGTAELESMLGEDFLSVFESSPVPASIDVSLVSDYVVPDSLEMVKAFVMESPLVDEIEYQQSLIEALNANLRRISMVLGVFIALLLFISYVLINNTVRLGIFSRRFTIHTMKLVGATKSFIRAPFLIGSVFQGLFSAGVAVMMLIGVLFYLRGQFIQLFEIFSARMLLVVIGIVIVSGIVICLVSTWFAVNRLVSLSKDELYY